MLIALVLFNIIHPGRLMPGKESDFPSRKARKAAGKNGIMGRAGVGELPLYERSGSDQEGDGNGNVEGHGPTFPKIDGSSVNYGYVRDAE